MKKKIITTKEHLKRENTPEPFIKIKSQKTKTQANPINQGEPNISKKRTVKNHPPLSISSSIANIREIRMANNKSKNQQNEINKSMIEQKKENKRENKSIYQSVANIESRPKSAVKRTKAHKNKDKDKDKNKKEDNVQLTKKNIIEKDNNINKDINTNKDIINKDNNNNKDNTNKDNKDNVNKDNIQNNNQDNNNNLGNNISKDNINNKGSNKDNKDVVNKTEDSITKQKIIKSKNYKYDARRKSYDISADKNKIKLKENENNKTMIDNSKKRRPEIVLEKTPNKTKKINYNKNKEIAPLKTGKSDERGEFKFPGNRTKRQIMNKTPDAGRMRNHKMPKGENKKPKYGNVDIKSIIKPNKDKPKDNLNKDQKLNDNQINEVNKTNEENKISEIKEVKEVKIIKYRNVKNKKYNSNYVESLYLALNAGFFEPSKKLNILINSKELYSNFDNKKIIKELINYYNKNGNKNILNDKKIKYDIKKINEPFKPNETTINSLNFIDKNEEKKLINEIQHPYIIELFKAVLILLNEYKNNTENKNIFEYLFNDILQKYKVKNIKKLMINNFVDDRITFNDEQFDLIQKMLVIKPDLFSPATLLRYNRAVAYFSFFVKDLFSYLNLKTEDGKYYYKIRATLPKNKFQEKINKLKQLL
jgi:hypothetical protein